MRTHIVPAWIVDNDEGAADGAFDTTTAIAGRVS